MENRYKPISEDKDCSVIRLHPNYIDESEEDYKEVEDFVYPSYEELVDEGCMFGDPTDFTKLEKKHADYCRKIFHDNFGFKALNKFEKEINAIFIYDSKSEKVVKITNYYRLDIIDKKDAEALKRRYVGLTEDGSQIRFNPILDVVGFWINTYGLPYEMDSNEFLLRMQENSDIADDTATRLFVDDAVEYFLDVNIESKPQREKKRRYLLFSHHMAVEYLRYKNDFKKYISPALYIEMCRKTTHRLEVYTIDWAEVHNEILCVMGWGGKRLYK